MGLVRGSFIVGFAAVWCGMGLAAPARYEVTVTARDHGVSQVPVFAELGPSAAAPRGASLRTPDGMRVPCQLLTDGETALLAFMVRNLPQGESRTYTLMLRDAPTPPLGPCVAVTERDGDAEVCVGGAFFTRYVTRGGPKPYLYPIIGPTGKPVTRDYPMKEDTPGEDHDHVHHRSCWFTHDQVNGVNFWAEGDQAGRTVHRAFESLESGPVVGRIVATTDWVSADGRKICEDRRDVRVYATDELRLLDFDITWRASEGPLHLGDTKEGVFGFRVAETMKVDRGGHILMSNGQRDGDAWGKAAEWCDYSGPVDGQTVGISILDHPSNPGHPSHWHVRTYGLFCANIFGLSHFDPGSGQDGSLDVKPGEALRFRYRVLIHQGGPEQASLPDAYAAYANPPEVVLRRVGR